VERGTSLSRRVRVEAQILRDGELARARMFVLQDLAIGWAKNERDRLEASSDSREA
jgi:hypothetical protein